MDVAEPPRIVVESRASCTDADKAGELLRAALGTARAPRPAWTVKMSLDPTVNVGVNVGVNASANVSATPAAPAPSLRGEGEIIDEKGVRVADRILSVPAGDCGGLARAVGVWASLVLEQEATRGRAQAPSRARDIADSQSVDSLWPAPEPAEKPPPERDWYLHHDDSRDLELGLSGFLMAGAGAGAMAGASPYAIVEAGRGVFLRPALAFAEPLPALNAPPVLQALLVAARFDTCLRLPGLYARNQGMQLDVCGGADVGMLDDVTDDRTLPYVSLGPSVDLRGELGSLLSATIRGVAGVNVTSPTSNGLQPLGSGRLELAFSWKVQ